MSFGSKGSSPSGSTTVTQNNTPWNAASLQDVYNNAYNVYRQNPTVSDYLTKGYVDLANTADSSTIKNLIDATNNTYGTATSGGYGYGNSPAASYLDKVMNGDYLNKNPYLDKMYDAASDAVTRQYETATAPGVDSAAELGGRYGSGALSNAKSQAEQNLGLTLNKLASNIYGTDYENERALQSAAANTAQTGYDAGNSKALQALALGSSVLGSNYYPAQEKIAAGSGLTSEAWTPLSLYDSIVGTPVTGTTTTREPYFSNGFGSSLSGIGSVLGGVASIGKLFKGP